jgi:hypothetical protein
MALLTEQHHELVLAPARELTPQSQNAVGEFCRPGGLAPAMGAVRTALQGGEILAIVSPPPTIERLPADAEVPTGKSSVPPVS